MFASQAIVFKYIIHSFHFSSPTQRLEPAAFAQSQTSRLAQEGVEFILRDKAFANRTYQLKQLPAPERRNQGKQQKAKTQ